MSDNFYNFGEQFRMVGIEKAANEKVCAASFVGEKGVFRLSDLNQVKKDSEPIIIDMKAKIRLEPDDEGDFIITSLLNENHGKDVWGIVELTYDPVKQKVKDDAKTASYYQFAHPFAVRNRDLIEKLVFGSRMDLKVSLYQSPAEEAVDDSELDEQKLENTANALAEKSKEEAVEEK